MIEQTINQDLKEALLSGNKEKVSILRFIKSIIQDYKVNKQLDRQEYLPDNEVIVILNKEIKKLNESKEIYITAGSLEKVEQIDNEKSVILAYLPELISDNDLEKIVKEVIGSNSSANFGELMKLVKDRAGVMADGSKIASLIKGKLNS